MTVLHPLGVSSGAGPVRLAVDGAVAGLDPTTRFLLGLACLLLLAHGAGRLARRAGQPAILAELAVGVLLGPSLFGALAPDAQELLFGPEVRPALDGLAQLGLVLYALQVGRMLSGPGRAGSDGREGGTVIAVSVASFVVPMAVGAALAFALDDTFAGPRATPVAFSLFLGCALGITALPVLARLLQDEGLTDTPAGRISLAAAAIGDAAAWCVLTAALVGAGTASPARLLVAALGVLTVLLLLRLRGSRPDAAAAAAPARPRDLAVLVAGCVLAAAVSSAAGLHQLLGAMVFGCLWGKGRPVPDGVDTVASKVLLPCFFLGFGQRLDLGAVAWTPGFLGLLAGLTLLAAFTKLVPCAAVGAAKGLPADQWMRLGVLMNSRGLTEIVVLSVGYDAGLIDRTLLVALTVVALVTTAAAGPGLRLLDRTLPRTEPREPLRR
ncbi:cation:proton antiporter [Streptomyces sp. NPDC050145]|uniref:cation:proton antiporter n=1 Tax=Streptomyces sp. NPDC050145 TaxID=3365602 RepID=UPI00378BA58B